MPEIIESLVDGGNAKPGPPLGPMLGPTGVNIKMVIDEVNKKTKDFEGMKVPVKITIDSATKKFEIEIGTPPTSALLKKEIGLAKGGKDKNFVGNITMEQILKVVKMKKDIMLASNLKAALKEAAGTCVSMSVTIENMPPKDFIKAVAEGKFDERIN
ncbi:MAG: 50S ribosomal protein L11 [Candidatus Altiarchaeales archaeon A3]|nr:MAG: 50S ribosomal protein L11 [Candidatus Altiarchaeales archaeon A3]